MNHKFIVLTTTWGRSWFRTCLCFALQIASFCPCGTVTTLTVYRLYSERTLVLKAVVDILINMGLYGTLFRTTFCRFFALLPWKSRFL
nr:hypothetical protein Iba_chr02bCG0240 [Ipomoea batatas]GME07016.1 hypothetical protein Iba_scaffold5767CG0810 [Ipomoea batatas]GME07017.1 hypothetical protein Iba_scaffold5767CG0820 [Ipomoea batatas]